jgi:hypothetical protein
MEERSVFGARAPGDGSDAAVGRGVRARRSARRLAALALSLGVAVAAPIATASARALGCPPLDASCTAASLSEATTNVAGAGDAGAGDAVAGEADDALRGTLDAAAKGVHDALSSPGELDGRPRNRSDRRGAGGGHAGSRGGGGRGHLHRSTHHVRDRLVGRNRSDRSAIARPGSSRRVVHGAPTGGGAPAPAPRPGPAIEAGVGAARIAAEVALRVAVPFVLLLALVVVFLAVHDRFDRGDAKLSVAATNDDARWFR